MAEEPDSAEVQVQLAEKLRQMRALALKTNRKAYLDNMVKDRQLGPSPGLIGYTLEAQNLRRGRVDLIKEMLSELGFGGVRRELLPRFQCSEKTWNEYHKQAMAELKEVQIRPVHETKSMLLARLEEMYEETKNKKLRLKIMDMISKMGGGYVVDQAVDPATGDAVMPPSEVAAAMDEATLGGVAPSGEVVTERTEGDDDDDEGEEAGDEA